MAKGEDVSRGEGVSQSCVDEGAQLPSALSASADAPKASVTSVAADAPKASAAFLPQAASSDGACPKASVQGLTSEQVRQRRQKGQVNSAAAVKTRSVRRILRDNVCTLFNLVNVILAALVLFTGSFKNMLFMVVIAFNVVIGVVQELRSKRATDRLAIVTAQAVEVMRDGKVERVPVDQLVVDDVMRLGRGSQIPSDAEVVDGSCKVDESLLTGESALVPKSVGDKLFSGSFVSAGVVWARVVHVGADNYAAQIAKGAKQVKQVNSQIMTSLNKIVKYVSITLPPVGLLLFGSTVFVSHASLDSAILSTVAALVGMIPEGLILLTSMILAVAVVRLARRKVLVQQLFCIETLARVDVLCLDKTGTITTGRMSVSDVVPLKAASGSNVALENVIAALAATDPDPNETAQAIACRFDGKAPDVAALLPARRVVPFSSEVKWSGATLANGESFVMGAAQFVLASDQQALDALSSKLDALATDARVLLVASVEGFNESDFFVGTPRPLGFVCIQDEIRPTAARTIRYFIDQGVTLKVISGDDPHTVSGIARRVGVPDADRFVDATTLSAPADVASAIACNSVFGRVRPEQKKEFVQALQCQGHIVAMTGDGVNDVLALRIADCSVAMAAGSDAARNVAELVLVDNDFASMPHVVAEGRRSINNLQRSASLFLQKTLYSIAAAVLFIFLPWEYPFDPIQMTLIAAFTIGIPSFVLALEPNRDRVCGTFLSNCVSKSVPGAVCVVASFVAISALANGPLHMGYPQSSTLCVALTSFIGVLLVIRLSLPYTPLRVALLVVVVGGLALGATVFGRFFDMAAFTPQMWMVFGVGAAVNTALFVALHVVRRRFANRLERRRDGLKQEGGAAQHAS